MQIQFCHKKRHYYLVLSLEDLQSHIPTLQAEDIKILSIITLLYKVVQI